MDKTSLNGEVMRNAQKLVISRGDDALEYARMMAEKLQDAGEKEDQAFWESEFPIEMGVAAVGGDVCE
ncbi:MAG: hypothetical protein HQ513_17680 [Rhodospirillales bacterium]|nr:hypothetical protein [Rhodospirillales bacterium]